VPACRHLCLAHHFAAELERREKKKPIEKAKEESKTALRSVKSTSIAQSITRHIEYAKRNVKPL
jgi:hypothetical protein